MTNDKLTPKIRFRGFSDPWEQRKFGDLFARRSERNNGEFNKTRWISVAKMYFQNPEKVQSNNIDTRTFVFRLGDIAFEGHPNKHFTFGRFVENDIGDGIISELFPIYKHIVPYNLAFWKFAIHREESMHVVFAHSLTSSGNSSNKINENDFLKQNIAVPVLEEQKEIGGILDTCNKLIAANEDKLTQLKELKKLMMQKIFSQEWRFKGYTDPWEQCKLKKYISEYIEKSTIQDQYPMLTSSQQQGLVYQSDYYTKGTTAKSNIGYYVIPSGYFTYRSRSDNGIFKFNRNNLGATGIVSYFYPVFQIEFGDSNFFATMLNYAIKKDIMIESEGTGQRVLSVKKFKNIKTLFPTQNEQRHIGDLFAVLLKLIAANEEKLEQLKKMKKYLMQNMFV